MPKDSLKDKVDGNELDLSLSNLEVVPVKELAAIPKATRLDLSCNLLVTLPDPFCSLTHLVKIDLSKNRLSELPEQFGRLESLQHLDLLGNSLTTLPESFANLRKLKWLDLKDNPLEPALLKNAGDCLDEKQCRICATRILLYMKELSSELERRRQKKLKEKRAKEEKLRAAEEEEAKLKRAEKKAEKERRKLEMQQRKSKQKEEEESTEEEQGAGDSIKAEKKSSKSDNAGSGCLSCCVMFLSILAVLVALCVGLVLHCNGKRGDPYCATYYKPVETRVLAVTRQTQRQLGQAWGSASKAATPYLKSAEQTATRWYAEGARLAVNAYSSGMEAVNSWKGGAPQAAAGSKT